MNPKPFPKVLGQKLVSDVVKEMEKGMDKLECEDQSILHKLYKPARIRFQQKISSTELAAAASTFPLLPTPLPPFNPSRLICAICLHVQDGTLKAETTCPCHRGDLKTIQLKKNISKYIYRPWKPRGQCGDHGDDAQGLYTLVNYQDS